MDIFVLGEEDDNKLSINALVPTESVLGVDEYDVVKSALIDTLVFTHNNFIEKFSLSDFGSNSKIQKVEFSSNNTIINLDCHSSGTCLADTASNYMLIFNWKSGIGFCKLIKNGIYPQVKKGLIGLTSTIAAYIGGKEGTKQ